jgi:uncharacterized radical SAM superfamily protein
MEDDECPDCGRRFLQEVMDAKAALIDRLPDLTEKKGFKAAVVVGGSLGLTVVLVVLLAIIGLFF